MSQIQMAAVDAGTVVMHERIGYDPLFCKTCQKKGAVKPAPARVLYSDCEKHYKMRIKKLRLTGVYVI
jgi:hypothetical protein